MRRLDIWFMFCIAALLALPTAGLGLKAVQTLATGPISAGGAVDDLPWLKRAELFITGNYGFRNDMIDIGRDIRNVFLDGSPRVIRGSDGWLFLNQSDVLSQVTGQRLDLEGVEEFAAMAAALDSDAKAAGRQFLVAVAPNKHTIYRGKLPLWARTPPQKTELDVLMEALAARNIAAVDLRPGLIARSASRTVYFRGDTHWSPYGAAIAFNDIVAALRVAATPIDLDADFAPETTREMPGDLVRLAEIAGPWPESVSEPRAGVFVAESELEKTTPATGGAGGLFRLRQRDGRASGDGPKVMVIGDSFSVGLFGPLFMRFASEYTWTSVLGGAFDRSTISESDPDIVILELVERDIPFVNQRP